MNNPMGFNERKNIETYLSEIHKYTPLSRDEEITLARRIKEGDDKAFETFVNHNLLLVVSMAKQYMHQGLNLEDLIQFGNIGLMTAVHNYAFEIGVKDGCNFEFNKFNSMAVWHIRKEITDALDECGSTIRTTHNNSVLRLKIRKVSDSFEVKNGRAPKTEELAEMLGETETTITKVIGSILTPYSTDSNVDSDDDESQTYGDLLPSYESADDIVKVEDTKTEVNGMLSVLSERERKVVMMSFGIGYDCEYEPCTIADRMGLGTERVRQILKESMKKLRAVASK